MRVLYKIYWPGLGYYFGKTKGFRKRRNRHLREMKDGTHHNKNLIRFYLRYGEPKIKIIKSVETDELLSFLENQYIQKFASKRRCLNIQKWSN